MKKMKIVVLLALGLSAAAVGPATAQKRPPSATIVLQTKSIGFIFGAQWGGGTLTFRGRKYQVRVRVFEAGVIGFQGTSFTGQVYNLRTATDIEGTYAGGGAAIALGGGVSSVEMKNSKGVLIKLQGSSAGIMGKIAAKGFEIRLRK